MYIVAFLNAWNKDIAQLPLNDLKLSGIFLAFDCCGLHRGIQGHQDLEDGCDHSPIHNSYK